MATAAAHMQAVVLQSTALLNASCLGRSAGVALLAVRTAGSRSTLPQLPFAHAPCFASLSGGSSGLQQRKSRHDTPGYCVVRHGCTPPDCTAPTATATATTTTTTTTSISSSPSTPCCGAGLDLRCSAASFGAAADQWKRRRVAPPAPSAGANAASTGPAQGQSRGPMPGLFAGASAAAAGPARAPPVGGQALRLLGGAAGHCRASAAQGGALSNRPYQTISASMRADIQEAAMKKQTGVSLKYLLDFGTQPLERQMLLSARFLHSEIPVRLAHRLMDLNHLPPGLSNEPHVRRVKGWYAASFADFRTFPPIRDNMDVVRFTAMLKNAFRRHNNVVPAIAKGVEEYKRALLEAGESSQERESEIQHFLDTFFLSRIAIRFLAGHHIAMFEPPRPDHIGLVQTRCSPYLIASDAVSEARAICFREYGGAPQVTVLGNTGLTMAYVPSHLHHMVFELVKNSLRAVQERFSESESEPPPIQVVVAEGLEDVTIKVSDQGGGIPRSGLCRIWTYLYTTARSPLPDVDIDSTNMPAVLAGYGCGLPLSRLYARYFGGDLQIISMEGYGTDAYLHLNRLGNDEEPLPGAV